MIPEISPGRHSPDPGTRPAGGILFLPVLLALVVLLTAFTAPAQTDRQGETDLTDPEELAEVIMDLMRQDRRAEALPLCRTYIEEFPDDPSMLYNLACLENMAGRPEEALAAFTAAMAAGFDDLPMAFNDPDLASLKYHPDMINLSLEHQLRLSRLATARAVTLAWQETSPPVPLVAGYSEPMAGDPEIRLTWTPVGLGIELHAGGVWSSLVGPDNLAPWNGGAGLVFTLGIPDSSRSGSYQSANHFLFAFGMEKGTATGATFLADQNRWQTISELHPKIRLDEADNLELRTTIPWAAILPYNPLVDDQMGINATLRLTGPGAPTPVSLIPDPAAFRPSSALRRVVPVAFRAESVGEEVFVGKVSNTISGTDPVTLDLVAVSLEEGTGRLDLDFLGGPGQSLLPDGRVSGTLKLTRGLNRLTRQADFTALETGAYLIKAELTFPSGGTLSWDSNILQLAPGWQKEYRERIDRLNPEEKPTAAYHFDSITEAIDAHHPRRGPGAIVTTLVELGRMLDSANTGGSILPDQGSFLAVYSGPDGDTRLCHLYLPALWKTAGRLNPVLTFTSATGTVGAIAGRLGRNYEQGNRKPTFQANDEVGFPVYLVPRLAPVGARQPVDWFAETEACLAWARSTFASATVSVVGVDQAAGYALRLAGLQPGSLNAMLIFAGGNLEPWPQADKAFIEKQLGDFPVDLPLTWNDFVHETDLSGQGPTILQVLQRLGVNILEVQEVRGALNFTQIADRTVLWTESLR